ncbi:hypothetical protein BGX28_006119 [Mortierella sp. GBA30]|nr:hypothetical protein BGX28_006119 [Mortierella sp. GBA30]
MGQNQSQEEEPYHRRHYNETNQQIRRQNSLSLSTTNLLLNRDSSLRRAGTLRNYSSPSLGLGSSKETDTVTTPTTATHKTTITRTATSISGATKVDDNYAELPTPFIRLLPIEKESIYFDETDESDEDSTTEEEDNVSSEYDDQDYDGYSEDEYHKTIRNRKLAPSPSFMESAINVNSRLSRSDSFEQYPRDRADFQRAKDEEEEDLSYLSPVSGKFGFTQSSAYPASKAQHSLTARPFLDHNHPRYYERDDEDETQESEVDYPDTVKRYQLSDRPAPSLQESVENLAVSKKPYDAKPLYDATTLKSQCLDVIREEEEERLGHPRGLSSNVQEDSEQSTGRYHAQQPLQESNNSSSSNCASQLQHAKDPSALSQQSMEEYFHLSKTDLNMRIQQAVQEVEQKFADRVQRLEAHTASLGITSNFLASVDHLEQEHKDSNQRPQDVNVLQPQLVLTKVSQEVGNLDSRVDQMETLISYKLTDIESKVQELYAGHDKVAQMVQQSGFLQASDTQPSGAQHDGQMQQYDDDAKSMDSEGLTSTSTSTALIDKTMIMELRRELQAFGTRYHELNDGLLTDLMSQMRDAKLRIFDTVNEVDQRLGKRVDRIEAEMHARLLSGIENRIQERVLAMEQMSSRLERCFDKMDGRLGALETVLASKQRMRPESMYRLLQQQQQEQIQQLLSESSALTTETYISGDSGLILQRLAHEQEEDDSNSMMLASPSTVSSGSDARSSADSSVSSISSIRTTRESSTRHNKDSISRPPRILTAPSERRPDAFVKNPLEQQGGRKRQNGNMSNASSIPPHSAGPVPARTAWNRERAMTMDNLPPTQLLHPQRSLNLIGAASRTGNSNSTRPVHIPAATGTKPAAKVIRRPSSYKELLHFWKAGGSTPDLLNGPNALMSKTTQAS